MSALGKAPRVNGEGAGRVVRALELARERADLGAFWALDEAAAGSVRTRHGPLAGVPVAVKDMYDQRGLPTTAGLAGPVRAASADAELVARVRRAGAVPIGKTAMDQLGCTTGGQAPGFPPCVNPIDAKLSPGGSSSGSAVAVAAGIVPLALGTDTAGSTRIPAAYCGIVGLKPWRRALPRRGVTRVMPAFDAPGLLAESVELITAAYEALTGRAVARPRGRLRLAVLTDMLERAEPPVAAAAEKALERLAEAGASIHRVELRWEPRGFGQALAFEFAQTWGRRVEREPEAFTEVIRDTVEFGRGIEESRYREVIAGFGAARVRLRRRFGDYDALVLPTAPIPAPAREDENVAVSTSFTRLFNALDWPALSVPIEADGVAPIGLQFAAPPSRLGGVLAAGAALEAAA